MLDLGFREDLETLLQAAPAERRTLLLSATLPAEIRALARRFQRDALAIDPRKAGGGAGGAGAGKAAHEDITHRAHLIAGGDRLAAVVNVLRAEETTRAIVFCTTREGVAEMHAALVARGFAATAISGDRAQAERDRALEQLRRGDARVLVATNVAARGLHLPDVDLIVHADLPLNADSLIHRSGRTGRAGRKGTAVVIATVGERRKAERLLGAAHVKVEWTPPPSARDDRGGRARAPGRRAGGGRGAGGRGDGARPTICWRAWRPSCRRAICCAGCWRASWPGCPSGSRCARSTSPRRARAIARAAPGQGPPWRRRTHGEFAREGVAFRVNLGAKDRAEPRWLLPLICRRGGVSRREVGAIRIGPNETIFEIAGDAAADFALAASEPDPRARHVVIERADAPHTRGPSARPSERPAPRETRARASPAVPAPAGAPAAARAGARAVASAPRAPEPRRRREPRRRGRTSRAARAPEPARPHQPPARRRSRARSHQPPARAGAPAGAGACRGRLSPAPAPRCLAKHAPERPRPTSNRGPTSTLRRASHHERPRSPAGRSHERPPAPAPRVGGHGRRARRRAATLAAASAVAPHPAGQAAQAPRPALSAHGNYRPFQSGVTSRRTDLAPVLHPRPGAAATLAPTGGGEPSPRRRHWSRSGWWRGRIRPIRRTTVPKNGRQCHSCSPGASSSSGARRGRPLAFLCGVRSSRAWYRSLQTDPFRARARFTASATRIASPRIPATSARAVVGLDDCVQVIGLNGEGENPEAPVRCLTDRRARSHRKPGRLRNDGSPRRLEASNEPGSGPCARAGTRCGTGGRRPEVGGRPRPHAPLRAWRDAAARARAVRGGGALEKGDSLSADLRFELRRPTIDRAGAVGSGAERLQARYAACRRSSMAGWARTRKMTPSSS